MASILEETLTGRTARYNWPEGQKSGVRPTRKRAVRLCPTLPRRPV